MSDHDELEIKEFVSHDERPRTTIKSPKFNNTFTIKKSENGYGFYEVQLSKGVVPKELDGQYTRMSGGVRHVINYIGRAKVSKTVQRDETYARNHPDKKVD